MDVTFIVLFQWIRKKKDNRSLSALFPWMYISRNHKQNYTSGHSILLHADPWILLFEIKINEFD